MNPVSEGICVGAEKWEGEKKIVLRHNCPKEFSLSMALGRLS